MFLIKTFIFKILFYILLNCIIVSIFLYFFYMFVCKRKYWFDNSKYKKIKFCEKFEV